MMNSFSTDSRLSIAALYKSIPRASMVDSHAVFSLTVVMVTKTLGYRDWS